MRISDWSSDVCSSDLPAAHLPRILGDQIILARAEKPLAIIPGCADQWNAAGKRFENPDGWDARKRLNIKSAGYMDSRQPPGKNSRSHRVGNPAMIAGARQAQSHQGMGGITHDPNVKVQTGRLAWKQKNITQYQNGETSWREQVWTDG